MDNVKQIGEKDTYDYVVDGVAIFCGIFVGTTVRLMTSQVLPENDTYIKKLLRESGSMTLMTLATNMTISGVTKFGKFIKPHLMK